MKVVFTIVTLYFMVTICVIAHEKRQNLALDGVEVRSEKLLCYWNPKYLTNFTCNVKVKSRQTALTNAFGTLNRKLSTIKFTMKLYYQFSSNEYRPLLINVAGDYCAADPGLYATTLLNHLKLMVRNATNVFQPCPILPGVYYLKEFNFSAFHLPNIIPAGRYIAKGTFNSESDSFLNASLYFYVANHGILDMRMG